MKRLDPIGLYWELVSQKLKRPAEPLRLLGLQIGATHVGVAMSDVPTRIVGLHCIMERKKGWNLTTKFRKLIDEQSVGGIVVGVPSNIQVTVPEDNPFDEFVNGLKNSKKLKDVKFTTWDDDLSESKGVGCLLVPPLPLKPPFWKENKCREINRCATAMLQDYIYVNKKIVFADLGDDLETLKLE